MPAIPLLSISELESQVKEMGWLVKRMIPLGIVTLYAEASSFKSFLALDLALHCAHGLDYLGLKTRSGPVVYVAAEGGLGILGRIRAWHAARGLDMSRCPLYVVPVPVDMVADAGAIVSAVSKLGIVPVLVVVDTLAQTNVGSENDSAEVSAFYRTLNGAFALRWRCTVLVVHHVGHAATDRPRGSSAIGAASDALYAVTRTRGAPYCTLTCDKLKDGSSPPPVSFRMDTIPLGTDDDGDQISSLAPVHLANESEIARSVETGPDSPKKRILEIACLSLPVKEARRQFYSDSDCETQEAKKKEWQRSLAWAIESKLAAETDGILHRTTGQTTGTT